MNDPGRGKARNLARCHSRKCGPKPEIKITKRQRDTTTTDTTPSAPSVACPSSRRQVAAEADHLASDAAVLAFRLAAIAERERTARAARYAIDALQLAEAAYRLSDALSIEMEVRHGEA